MDYVQVMALESFDNTVSAAPGDHDQPYRFGQHPSTLAPFPFSTRQLARLLIVRASYHRGEHDSAALWPFQAPAVS